jgi:hypothetical protein
MRQMKCQHVLISGRLGIFQFRAHFKSRWPSDWDRCCSDLAHKLLRKAAAGDPRSRLLFCSRAERTGSELAGSLCANGVTHCRNGQTLAELRQKRRSTLGETRYANRLSNAQSHEDSDPQRTGRRAGRGSTTPLLISRVRLCRLKVTSCATGIGLRSRSAVLTRSRSWMRISGLRDTAGRASALQVDSFDGTTIGGICFLSSTRN